MKRLNISNVYPMLYNRVFLFSPHFFSKWWCVFLPLNGRPFNWFITRHSILYGFVVLRWSAKTQCRIVWSVAFGVEFAVAGNPTCEMWFTPITVLYTIVVIGYPKYIHTHSSQIFIGCLLVLASLMIHSGRQCVERFHRSGFRFHWLGWRFCLHFFKHPEWST